jgi:hypothetical protein
LQDRESRVWSASLLLLLHWVCCFKRRAYDYAMACVIATLNVEAQTDTASQAHRKDATIRCLYGHPCSNPKELKRSEHPNQQQQVPRPLPHSRPPPSPANSFTLCPSPANFCRQFLSPIFLYTQQRCIQSINRRHIYDPSLSHSVERHPSPRSDIRAGVTARLH